MAFYHDVGLSFGKVYGRNIDISISGDIHDNLIQTSIMSKAKSMRTYPFRNFSDPTEIH